MYKTNIFIHNTNRYAPLYRIAAACAAGADKTAQPGAGAPAGAAYTFRKLTPDEIPAALSLAWEVFSEFETPVYPPEGTEKFKSCLKNEQYLAGLAYYGAFDGTKLIGQLGIRTRKMHICFFFVKGDYHRRGIGTSLFALLRRDYPDRAFTLNSSPYGLPFYKALGFIPTDSLQTVNGIDFTPMKYTP